MKPMEKEAFYDYYEILQVSPKAGQEMIERAYRLLAKKYHPDNKQTGDAGKFGLLMEAYRVLSEPQRRSAYDHQYKPGNTSPNQSVSKTSSPGDPRKEMKLHEAILLALYFARRKDVTKPGIGIFQLEKLLALPEKELEFHVWYLKEKGWIERLETGEFAITVSGVDTVLEKNLILGNDRLLPTSVGSSSHFEESKRFEKASCPIAGDASEELSN